MICSISANDIESCIADNTKTKFQITKPMIVTVDLVVTVCRVILLYEGRESDASGTILLNSAADWRIVMQQ